MKKTIWALAVVFGVGLLAADASGQAVDPKTLVDEWSGHWTYDYLNNHLRGQYHLSIKSVDAAGRVAARIESTGNKGMQNVSVPPINADRDGRLEGNHLVLGRDDFTIDGNRMSGERRMAGNAVKIELTRKK